jgi:hypothetical protein
MIHYGIITVTKKTGPSFDLNVYFIDEPYFLETIVQIVDILAYEIFLKISSFLRFYDILYERNLIKSLTKKYD